MFFPDTVCMKLTYSYNTIDQEQPILINYSQCQAEPFIQISQKSILHNILKKIKNDKQQIWVFQTFVLGDGYKQQCKFKYLWIR